MPQFTAPLARQESLSDEIKKTAKVTLARGPAYFNGASHGSTGLVPPRWKYEFERPGGDDFWHKESQPSPHIFNRNKHQHVWASDRAISGPELGNGTASTMPLDVLERRKSFTQRPIAIVSGTHGAWHGNDWDNAGGRDTVLHEQAFLTEDIQGRLNGNFVPDPSGPFEGYHRGVKVKGYLTGFTLKRAARTGLEYYVSDSAKKGSFESRIRVYDAAKLTEKDFRTLIADTGNHVILGYCFSRNDEGLRYKGAGAALPTVTSYLSAKKLPLGAKRLRARAGTIVTMSTGRNIAVPCGAMIEDSPAGRKGLLITQPGGAVINTGPYATLWFPPAYNPQDPQAPTEAVYKAYNP